MKDKRRNKRRERIEIDDMVVSRRVRTNLIEMDGFWTTKVKIQNIRTVSVAVDRF